MKTISFFISLFLLIGNALIAQVSINTDNSVPDNSAMLDVKSNNKGFLTPRMTQSERNTINSPAVGLLIFQTDNTPGYYYYNGTGWILTSAPKHYIGELCGGGIVFYVDNTELHGLIVSLVDISSSSTWSNIIDGLIGITAQSLWNGQSNSTAIMGQAGHISSAAKLCDVYTNVNYNTGIYSDWYLPAIDELSLIYHVRYILNKKIETITGANIISPTYYWSSMEYGPTSAWAFTFALGYANYARDKNFSYWVRAIRAF